MASRTHHPLQGFVLVTALIFLVVLTLVAVIAVKGTGLELRMSSNNALHVEAFEAAESRRQTIGRLIEALGFNAATGWPASIGGGTPDAQFAYPIPDGLSIYNASGTTGGTPSNWFDEIPEDGFSYGTFSPVARYNSNVAPSGTATFRLTADIDVQRMRTVQKVGSDLGSGGYDGGPKVDLFFYIVSRGVDSTDATAADPANAAVYETSAVFRYVPKN